MAPIQEAITLYEHAYLYGWWHRLGARLRGRSAQLLDLTAAGLDSSVTARRYLGAQAVPVEQIRGSENQRGLFDDAFHPLQPRPADRWLGVATTWLQGVVLPPVELIRLGDSYFVRDGHHRISVVRALGIKEIDAVVTVWDVAVAPSSGHDAVAEKLWPSILEKAPAPC
jgi:hypothetical protein